MVEKNRDDIIQEILTPFSDGMAGEYLRYDPVYDQIRDARTEDDQRLSRGVWQIEFKKSDHGSVQSVCVDALTKRTKDLQIASWLAESWMMLYGAEGFFDGISLIHAFVKKYYEIMHPLDEEHRLRLFEWIDNEFKLRLYTYPLTQFSEAARSYTYHDVVAAKTFDAALRREPADSAKQIERAHKRGDALLPHVNQAIAETPKSVMVAHTKVFRKIQQEFKELKAFLDEKLGKEAPGFTQIFATLTEIMRITKSDEVIDAEAVDVNETVSTEGVDSTLDTITDTEKETTPLRSPEPVSIPVKASDVYTARKSAYSNLRELADTFSKIEPHSPTANVLKKVSEWENKKLVDILGTFSQSPDALHIFMGFISDEKSEVQ